MASESKRKTNKQSTITFTLPLSCQICLGKVKQPVLCPNHHVFCQLCMDIWLEKNKQCPTCRVDINDTNPVKSIIGGQLEDEDVKKQSSAELRRARFELLYKEYEDQFDQMRKESIILKTENNILLAQLQDAEDKRDTGNDTEAKGSSSGKNEPNLLMLTKNLQEAQTLYAGIKEEMKQLKQENSKLKDENVNLTRENETLRLEIAQRSPKKFGRYTVATLETKLSEYEKEIRQLKRALERSDEYVEDLEKQIEKLSNSRHEQYDQKLSGNKKMASSKELAYSERNGHAYANGTEQSTSDSDEHGDRKITATSCHKETPLSQDRESARRILFSLCAENGNTMSQRSGGGNSKAEAELGEDTEHVKYPESIMKNGGGGEGSHRHGNANIPELNGKIPKTKKVQFNVPKSANSSASFELEMPSPYGNNRQSLPNQKEINKDNVDDKGDEVDGSIPPTDFDTHVVSLLKKANGSNYSSNHIPGIKLTSSGDLISKHETSGRNPISKKVSTKTIHYEDSNDSSRLSLPDFDSPRKLTSSDSDGLSDSPIKSILAGRDDLLELDGNDDRINEKYTDNKTELDISMTPEMSDCLRLLNQAELKLEMPHKNSYSDRGMNFPSSLKSNPASFQVTSSHSGPPTAYNTSFKPQSFSSSESIKSWEQEFFRGLQANPYKPYKFNNPPSSIPPDNSKDLHDGFSSLKKSQSSQPHSSISQSNPNTSALSINPANQNYLSSVVPSNLPYNSSSNINGGGSVTKSNSNPSLSHFDKFQSFTSSIPISLSSSDFPYKGDSPSSNSNPLDRRLRAPTQPPGPSSSSLASNLFSLSKNPSNHPSSSSSKDIHIGLYSSTHAFNPSSSSSHTNYRNPLPPSLNNSSLEWPDSPARNFIPSDLTIAGSSSSKDFLTQTSSLRDRNRFTSLTGSSSPRNFQSRSNQDYMFASANSSFSSDVNNSSFLPEPKKRLFNLDDELDLPTSKTAKK